MLQPANDQRSSFSRFNDWAGRSVTLKLLVIGLLFLLLMIPAFLVEQLVQERQYLRDNAQTEVAGKWGLDQEIGGPVISVPYTYGTLNTDGKTITKTGYAHFLPDRLDISGTLQPQQRRRGIYVVVLYTADLAISGNFAPLNAAALAIPEESLRWEDALITIGITDMKGVNESITLNWSNPTTDSTAQYSFGPGTITNDIFGSGASIPIDLRADAGDAVGFRTRHDFSFTLSLNGSSRLYFLPFGRENSVKLSGAWADPSFEGEFLPEDHNVSTDGFMADWTVLQLNRNYPQQNIGSYVPPSGIGKYRPSTQYSDDYGYEPNYGNGDSNGAFGVRLLLPVDEYQKTERSTKYSMLFVFLTFLTFFFIEVINGRRLHPIQYLLIGAAVVLFYVLLLSISEHVAFGYAYLLACSAVIALITMYSYFILENRGLTLLVAGVLIVLYIFFYSLLQLQDYALLMGSIGLLLILATIMYLTRNIDWYRPGQEKEEEMIE
ncbi:MAG: cell envelope integrity protein CreD [Saprospiraceae bacterium]